MVKKLGKNAKLDLILAELSVLRADINKLLEHKGAAAERSSKGGAVKKAAPRSASRKSVTAPSQAEDDEAEEKPGAAAERRTKGGAAKKAAPRSASRKAMKAPSQAGDAEAEGEPPLEAAGSRA
jgi:hypothetical protein